MRPSTIRLTEAGPGPWFKPSSWVSPFELVVSAYATDTASFDIEYTYDEAGVGTDDGPGQILVAETVVTDANVAQFSFPVAAVRINVTDLTAGEVRGSILQSGG